MLMISRLATALHLAMGTAINSCKSMTKWLQGDEN
jgi:hypothetical protein